ncbi:hypothetical protein [Actinomadura sp. NBRC 104425]|uniref:hypothetical protein n=1 Tax=Actinomadura sp. NBRC 104425 TaxID=3032204 RepID=UPI002556F858|nr:hypothetical protein [Actinomadura sp. NBRC 104425]
MGLPRPSEFQRVYSTPEPPSGRRPRLLAVVVALAAFALAAGAVFVLSGGDEGERAASASSPDADRGSATGPDAASTPAPSESPSSAAPSQTSASPPPTSADTARPITSLPSACDTVPRATVARLVPNAQRRESSNSTLTTCTYSSTGKDFRWLRVEAHLYAPADTATPVEDARGYFGAQWTQAHEATLERTVRLERQTGLGDEAFRWFKVDKGQPTVVGQVTMRIRNVVVTVAYSEQVRDAAAARERENACLSNAGAVAREVRGRFG